MRRRRLKRADVRDEDGHWLYSYLTDLLRTSEEAALTTEQTIAYHVYFYEVAMTRDGGHGEYFQNRGAKEAERAVDSLNKLGAPELAALLKRALVEWSAMLLRVPDEGRFDDGSRPVDDRFIDAIRQIDEEFNQSRPPLRERLMRYVEEREPLFFDFVGPNEPSDPLFSVSS